MKRRFIILVNNSNENQNTEFLKYIKDNGFGWWHYINNSWLLTTNKNFTANELRDVVRKIFNDEYNLIIELKGDTNDTWSGFGPNSDKKNMFKWLKEIWNEKK